MAAEVTAGVESLTPVNISGAALAQAGQLSSHPAGQEDSQVPASGMRVDQVPAPCPRQPAATGRHLSERGCPQPPQRSSASGGATCQTTPVPAVRGQQGERLFTARGEEKSEESNRESFETLGPWTKRRE